MTKCKHCDECEKTPVSFWELCDSWECIPDALIMSPPVCWSCGDNCTHTLKYITLNWLKAQLDLGDELVKAHPWDPCAWTLADKLDLSDTCFERTLDQTHATCPWWKWKLRLKNNCIKTSLIELTDGPWTYANCNVVEWTENEDCWCPLTTCPAWVLVSKCDGSGWERQCPNQTCETCSTSTIENNYPWHNKDVQFFWYSGNNNWKSWPQFLCPKKRFIAKIRRRNNEESPNLQLDKVWYRAPAWVNASYITNYESQLRLTNIFWSDIDPSTWIVWLTPQFNVMSIVIPHTNFYDIKMSWSCILNRGIHTIRHQVLVKRAWTNVFDILLDDRFEWAYFVRANDTDDNLIWVDNLDDLNRFDDAMPTVTNELRMDWWIARAIRGHWFWQSTEEYLNEGDEILFVYKVQTFAWDHEQQTHGKVWYVWDSASATNWRWVWIQFSVKERSECWPFTECCTHEFSNPIPEYNEDGELVLPPFLPWTGAG